MLEQIWHQRFSIRSGRTSSVLSLISSGSFSRLQSCQNSLKYSINLFSDCMKLNRSGICIAYGIFVDPDGFLYHFDIFVGDIDVLGLYHILVGGEVCLLEQTDRGASNITRRPLGNNLTLTSLHATRWVIVFPRSMFLP